MQFEWLLEERWRAGLVTPRLRPYTEDNVRKTVGQALGGAAVLIGAVAAYLQFTQQQQAAHDLHISNQVSKGFEQLAGRSKMMAPATAGGAVASLRPSIGYATV
jgi:hypothetical protein